MKAFEYVAADAAGKLVNGTAWADDEHHLDGELESKGLILTRSRPMDRRRGSAVRIGRAELVHLTNQLSTVTGAGVPIVEGLAGIGARMESARGRAMVKDLVASLETGESLSNALERHPRSFPAVYRASVRAGEASGALEVVLDRLARHLEWARAMRATTIQALIYPTILAAAIVGLILILLTFVLPRILTLFPGGTADLPGQTRIVVALSDFLRQNAVALIAAAFACGVGLALALRTERGRVSLHRLLLRAPHLGRVVKQIATAKFACTAGILHAAGCNVFTVLDIAASTCGNAAMTAAFRQVAENVRRGAILSHAFEQEPLADPLLVQMVDVGERTGRLDQSLDRLVQHLDQEVPRTVKRFLSLLEPTLLLGAGVIVAFILLATLLPIFEVYERIG